MRQTAVVVLLPIALSVSCGHGAAGTSHETHEAHGSHGSREAHRTHEAHRAAEGEQAHEYRVEHAHHRFDDAEAWAKRFEDPSRDEWQKPDVVLEMLALSPTSRVADIGAATGYFPVRIARKVPEGRVWGVDVEPDMVRFLNARAQEEGLSNLFSVLGTPADPLLPEPVDVVLVVNTYHHISDRTAYFQRLARHLLPGGRVVVVDFKPGDLPVGPPAAGKVPPDVVEAEMQAAGCAVEAREDERLPYQFVRVFSCARGEG